LIALYLIFLSLEWRGAVVQASVAVAILALVFLLVRLEQRRQGGATLREKVAIIGRSRLMLVLFLATVLTAGVESGAIGIMSTYLAELRGFEQLPAKLGLVVLLAGIAGGRLLVGALARPERIRRMMLALFALSVVAFSLLFLVDLRGLTLPMAFLAGIAMSSQLPLILSYTGLAYRNMTGTVLGAVKIGIPVGGIVIPLLFSAMTGATSFAIALWILPAGLLLGLVLLALPITQPKVTGQVNI